MRKALLAALAVIAALFVTPVWAANLPVKAPPAPVAAPEVYDWSGFYGGLTAGWAHSTIDWRYINPSPVTCCSPFSASLDDTIFGTVLGAQVQFDHFVVGVDAQLADFINDRFATQGFPSCVGTNAPAEVCEAQTHLTTTVGGRGGLAWYNWMVYGEGGWAHTTVETRVFTPLTTTDFDDTSVTHNGTYWGAGLDYMVGQIPHFAFIVGVEYQRIDFGTQTHLSSADVFGTVCGVNCRSISAKEDIVRVRLTGKWNPFDSYTRPIATRY